MEIFKKIGITPTCRKETIERQEKLGDKIILEQKILRRKIVEAERSLKKQQDKNSEVAQDQEPTEEIPSNDGQTSPPQNPETEPDKRTRAKFPRHPRRGVNNFQANLKQEI